MSIRRMDAVLIARVCPGNLLFRAAAAGCHEQQNNNVERQRSQNRKMGAVPIFQQQLSDPEPSLQQEKSSWTGFLGSVTTNIPS